MSFKFESLDIPEVMLITPQIISDNRGFFLETYKHLEFKENGIDCKFIQENYSRSAKGVLRGLHYQLDPKSQGKLVKVMRGSCLDVAVDLRKDSPHFGKHISIELSSENQGMLWIPPGFAHGFCALEESDFLYKTTEEYSPIHERGIRWDDPYLNINWRNLNPIVSPKDLFLPFFDNSEKFIIYGFDYRSKQ